MTTDERPSGGGTGGGPGGGDQTISTQDNLTLTANQISLLAAPPPIPGVPEPSAISIVAAGYDVDGAVDVRGSRVVCISAGPPPGLPATSKTARGVEIRTGQAETVSIERGLTGADQKIQMTPAGITINAGSMPVKVESLSEITLSVAGGTSRIRIAPDGITIEGVTVKITGMTLVETSGLTNKVSGLGTTIISAPMTMIG